MQLTDRHRQYWRKNLGLIAVLSAIWFGATFIMAWFARPLSNVTFFGWPFSFYMAAQGTLIVYVALIWYYARAMRKLDREYDVDEESGQ